MNNGYSADELSHMIKLPEHAIDNPWLTQARGQIPWHVKQIYYGNLGWYEGDPAFLLPISMNERSQKIIDGFGGLETTIDEIRKVIDNGEYYWAAELSTYALNVEPENTEVKLLKAHSLRVIGQKMISSDGRHWALTSALELEGKITIDPNGFTQTSPEQLAELPIEKLLKSLSPKLNPEPVQDLNGALNVIYTDTGKEFSLIFRNNILVVTEGLDDDPWDTLSLDTDTHKKILTKQLSIIDAFNSGLVNFDGTLEDLQWYYDVFDPLTVNAEGLRG
jgi:alkyl sulfatase BDS1-like metallo-beta-lactamase superfamily hydrolase